jgi:hypothetical protein
LDGGAARPHRIDAMAADAYVGFETVLLSIEYVPEKLALGL